jgi:TRAP-type C4-dicarboxylate transport system permease small subunit
MTTITEYPASQALLRLQRIVAISASVFITCGVAASAILRYVFKTSLFGLEELILIAAFWMYFIGASYAASRQQHLSAEIVSVYCHSPRIRAGIGLIADAITLSLSLLYTYWGAQFFYWGITEGGVTPVYRIPIVVSQAAIFVGFILMSWYFLIDFLRRGRAFLTAYAR